MRLGPRGEMHAQPPAFRTFRTAHGLFPFLTLTFSLFKEPSVARPVPVYADCQLPADDDEYLSSELSRPSSRVAMPQALTRYIHLAIGDCLARIAATGRASACIKGCVTRLCANCQPLAALRWRAERGPVAVESW